MTWIGKCQMCEWETAEEATPVLAGMSAYPHEKESQFVHDVRVVRVGVTE